MASQNVIFIFSFLVLFTRALGETRVCIPTADSHTDFSDLPLPYSGTTVTGAVIMMNASLVTEYNGKDQDKIIVDILGQGPVPWSISRFNQGDLSPRLQPRHPYSQTNLGVPGQPTNGFFSNNPKNFAVQAWRPSITMGVLLASVAQNGQKWNDGTPKFYGTVACVFDSEGYGYSMVNGLFGKEDTVDVTVGKAGIAGEGNIDVSLAWFPYDQGWTAGYVDKPNSKGEQVWQVHQSHSPNLPNDCAEVVSWSKHGRGTSLTLPGVAAVSDGMVFLTSTDPSPGNNDVNTIAVYSRRRHNGWRVQQREDSSFNVTELANPDQGMFAFVYVPWTAGGLIGGNIDGETGETQMGTGAYQVTRLGTGQYEITIGGSPVDKKSPKDGMLLLQVIGRDDSNRHYTKSAFLSYAFTPAGSMLVEAHHVVREASGGESFPFTDSDFSFVWVDFRNPLTPSKDSFQFLGVASAPVDHGSRAGFWLGFSLAVLILGMVAMVAYGVALYVRHRSSERFWSFSERPQEGDMLGSDLLRSEFRFGD